jgi:hypothetical protein
MNPIRTIRRLACMLTGLAAALAAAVAGAPAAFAATTLQYPPPGVLSRYEPVAPAVPAHIHAALTAGVTGWQIAVIVVGAAIVGAIVGVLLDRARAAHGHRPATAA